MFIILIIFCFSNQFIINIRYPNSLKSKQIVKTLDKSKLNKGEIISNSDPLYIDPKSKFINVLMNAYKDVTKDYKAKVEGYIDRVDLMKQGTKNVARILDYKTGTVPTPIT